MSERILVDSALVERVLRIMSSEYDDMLTSARCAGMTGPRQPDEHIDPPFLDDLREYEAVLPALRAALSAGMDGYVLVPWQTGFVAWVRETWRGCDDDAVLAGTKVTVAQLRDIANMVEAGGASAASPMSERDPEAVADWRAGLDHRDWLFDGHPIRGEAMLAAWNELDWTDAYVDLGPSVTGNPGPYWHVPRPSDDTVHRLYPKVLTGKWLSVIRRACEEVARSSRDAALEEAAEMAESFSDRPDRDPIAKAIRSLKSKAP